MGPHQPQLPSPQDLQTRQGHAWGEQRDRVRGKTGSYLPLYKGRCYKVYTQELFVCLEPSRGLKIGFTKTVLLICKKQTHFFCSGIQVCVQSPLCLLLTTPSAAPTLTKPHSTWPLQQSLLPTPEKQARNLALSWGIPPASGMQRNVPWCEREQQSTGGSLQASLAL